MYNKYAYSKYEGEAKVALDKFASEYIEFLSNKGINAIETNVKDCDFLITDDINSTSSKMKQAAKLNKKIVEYNFNFN